MITAVHHITSLDLPVLEPFKTLRRPIEHLQQGIFVAEGEKVIVRLLESSLTVLSILLSQDWFDKHHSLIESNRNGIIVYLGEKKLLETIVGHELHQSIMGLGTVPDQLHAGYLTERQNKRSLYVLVDGITNAENMGVIVRNCVCFNVDALLVLPSSCDPYLRRSVRNSMGNIFQLPVIYIRNTTEEIRLLQESGIRFIAAHPHSSSVKIQQSKKAEKCCIVLGAEGHGISSEVLGLCDEFVTIPMRPGVDSLNVASASAVLLWELQKTMKP
ncbi:MAG: RNA methyltransferase [Bacteroidetes bacterium]|nr:RNA methyltransferase [Bacteroidota bacterium]